MESPDQGPAASPRDEGADTVLARKRRRRHRKAGETLEPEVFATRAAMGLFAAGFVYFTASLVDFGTLWVLQRMPGPEWEFVAVSRTLEGMPRLILGLGLMLGAAWLAGRTSVAVFRVLGIACLGVAVLSGALGTLQLLNLFPLREQLTPESGMPFYSTVAKAMLLTGLYVVVMAATGIYAMRRPGSA